MSMLYEANLHNASGCSRGAEAFLGVAAAELGVTPSAISQAVRTLESRIGAALFTRTTRRVGLAQVPEPIVASSIKTGKFVQALQRFAPTTPGVFLYYPSQRQMLPKLRAFIDHVKSRSRDRTKRS